MNPDLYSVIVRLGGPPGEGSPSPEVPPGVSALARMEERRSSGVGSTANPL